MKEGERGDLRIEQKKSDGNSQQLQSNKVIPQKQEQKDDLKKNRDHIQYLLSHLEADREQEDIKIQELSKQIKRRMLQTNLSDRRALGGLLGTAILGIIGLAVGLNVIGIIIGGILGALLGSYAGKRIKENTIRKKKLLHINLYIIKFASFVQHLLDFNVKTVSLQEIRLLMTLLLSEGKMVILLSKNLQKYERKEVLKIERRLVKCLKKKKKYIFALKEMFWIAKEWCIMKESSQTNEEIFMKCKEVEKEIARISFDFLRPLSKLLLTNSRILDGSLKKLENKIQSLLMNVCIIELRDKYPEYSTNQEDAQEEFLDSLYREVDLTTLKEMMDDQIAQEILKEDQFLEMQKQIQFHNQQYQMPNSLAKIDEENSGVKSDPMNEDAHGNRQSAQDNTKYVVWLNSASSPKLEKHASHNNNNKSRLIDLIQMASHKKQQEQEFASCNSQKSAPENIFPSIYQQRENPISTPVQVNNIGLKNPIRNNDIQNPDSYVVTIQNQVQLTENIHEKSNCIENFQIVNKQDKGFNHQENRQTSMNQKNNQRVGVGGNNLQLKLPYKGEKEESYSHFNQNGYINPKYLSVSNEEDYALQIFLSTNPVENIQNDDHPKSTVIPQQQTNTLQVPGQIAVSNSCEPAENQFESCADGANYQTYVEEANTKNQVKVIQPVYSSNVSDNMSKLRVHRESVNRNNIIQMEDLDLQAAIEELKFDSIQLNKSRQPDKMKISIPQERGTASFARNKHGSVFLKMNSSDSIVSGDVAPIESTPTRIKPVKIKSTFVERNSPPQSQEETEIQRAQTEYQKSESLAEIQNNEIPQNVSVQQLKEENNDQIVKEEIFEQKYEPEKRNSQDDQVQYAKDDQMKLDHLVINMPEVQFAPVVNCDAEIELKFIRLRELDLEDPNKDKSWDKVIGKPDIQIYKKQVPNNPSVMIRAEATVENCSKEEIFDQIYYENYRKSWDKITLGFSVIQTTGPMQDVIYFYIDPGFGVSKRDFLQKRAVRKDFPLPGETTIIFFSTTHPSCPEKKGTIRAISHIAAYIIRPARNKDPSSTHLSIITQSDIKGQIPKYIVNFLSARAPAKWIESMRKGVFDHRKRLLQK